MSSNATEATPPASGRDARLDLLRGFCVALMLVSHLGWPRLGIRFPVGWMNAAEGFFLLSGVTLGLVARRYEETGRGGTLRRRLALRALWLYGVNLVLLAVARWLVAAPPFRPEALARRWRRAPEIVTWLNFDQPLALHLLPRYALFLLVAALVLPALRSRAGALALGAGSVAIWLANFLRDGALRLPWLETRQALFPAASWQILFFVGLVLAYRRGLAPETPEVPATHEPREAADRRFATAGWIAALGTFVFVVAARGGVEQLPDLAARLGPYLARDLLAPLRLANAAVVAVLAWNVVTRWREPLQAWTGWLLLPLGRNALPAYLLHLPLIWLGHALPFPAEPAWPRLAFGVAALAAIAWLVRWPRVKRILAPV